MVCYKNVFDIAPGIPGDFFVNEVNSTAIIVSWVRPSVTNGIITMYRVSYSRGNHSALDDGAIMVQITATANTSYEIIISELDPFTIYTLAVRAFTRIGSGNLSETLSILTDPSSKSHSYVVVATLVLQLYIPCLPLQYMCKRCHTYIAITQMILVDYQPFASKESIK